MPVFQFKVRTLESYLAAIGASSALVAAAFVMLAMLIGIVTFDAWPRAGLFSGNAGVVSLDAGATATQVSAITGAPDLVGLLAGPTLRAAVSVSAPEDEGDGAGLPSQPNGGIDLPGAPTAPQPPQQSPPPVQVTPSPGPSPVPPSGTEPQSPSLLSGVGNAVESDTTTLGNNLGGSENPVGGLVGGVGKSLGQTLNALGGSP
jgi:hypothetical protein